VIELLDEPRQESMTLEFVDGPRAGERTTLEERPPEVDVPDGSYRRSVRCADDNAIRYVWIPRETP
jgi:hypothetical protein